jgi:glutamate racemase
MNDHPIGIFDSGVGGYTVVRRIIDHLPGESIIYLGDSLRGPFGPRALPEVKSFALQIASFLEAEGVKLIVIACNSATAASLLDVQKSCKVPVIGVIEPGAHGAVQATANRRIGVIGTRVTIDSKVYPRAIHALDAGASVYTQACPTLVEYVERGEVDGAAVEAEVRGYLKPLLKQNIDTLILGCTHYPLLQPLIGRVAGEGVSLINSAEEVAREVERKLERHGFLQNMEVRSPLPLHGRRGPGLAAGPGLPGPRGRKRGKGRPGMNGGSRDRCA